MKTFLPQHRFDATDHLSDGLDLRGCALPLFLFMSIMFPTIFALSIRRLGDHTKLPRPSSSYRLSATSDTFTLEKSLAQERTFRS